MKKIQELSPKKSIRIDSRTIILVDRAVPDAIAKAHYLANAARSVYLLKPTKPKVDNRKKKIEEEELLEEINLSEEINDEEDE